MSNPDHLDDAIDLDALAESGRAIEQRTGPGAETSNLIHAYNTADQSTQRRIKERIRVEGEHRADQIVMEETGIRPAD